MNPAAGLHPAAFHAHPFSKAQKFTGLFQNCLFPWRYRSQCGKIKPKSFSRLQWRKLICGEALRHYAFY